MVNWQRNKNGGISAWRKNKLDKMFICFGTIDERDRRSDRETDNVLVYRVTVTDTVKRIINVTSQSYAVNRDGRLVTLVAWYCRPYNGTKQFSATCLLYLIRSKSSSDRLLLHSIA